MSDLDRETYERAQGCAEDLLDLLATAAVRDHIYDTTQRPGDAIQMLSDCVGVLADLAYAAGVGGAA